MPMASDVQFSVIKYLYSVSGCRQCNVRDASDNMSESSQISRIQRKRLWPWGVRLVVGLALLVFVFSRGVSLARVMEILGEGNPWRVGFALGVAVVGELLTAYKWSVLMRVIGGMLPPLVAIRASFIGMFYNNFLPGSVGGDIVRVLMISRYAGGKARAVASTFMQRNTGLAGLFFFGIPAAFLWPMRVELPLEIEVPEGAGWLLDTRVWMVGAAMGYCGVNIALFSRRMYGGIWAFLQRLAGMDGVVGGPEKKLRVGLMRPVGYLLEKLRRVHTELHGFRFWLGVPLLISVFTQLVDIFMVWNLAEGLGLGVPFYVLLGAVPVVTLANLIPVTVNGIGLREAMYVALLVAGAGAGRDQAVALSLMHFGVIIMLAAVGGVWQWKISGRI